MTAVLLCSEVDKAAELLTNKLTEILDQMAPIKKFQTRKIIPCECPKILDIEK